MRTVQALRFWQKLCDSGLGMQGLRRIQGGGLRSVLFLDMGVPPTYCTSKRSNHVGSCAGHQENPTIL